MNGMSEEPLAPQTFLYGCVLEAGKEVIFNPEDDEFEHQVDLRMACVDPATKDELHMVEVEGTDTEGQTVKAALVSLKPSTLPSVCLGGFTITPPAVFRLKAGSGPIHISGQHLVMMANDETFDEDDDEEEEEEEEEEIVKEVGSKKRQASSPAAAKLKKMKMDEEDDDDEDDDDDDDDEDDDDEDEDEESDAEESPVKAKQPPAKKKNPAQNGKSSAPSTPASKQQPKKARGEKSPKTPLKVSDVKTKMMELVKKGVQLPKAQGKFENYVKNCHRQVTPQDIAELWKWRQTLNEGK